MPGEETSAPGAPSTQSESTPAQQQTLSQTTDGKPGTNVVEEGKESLGEQGKGEANSGAQTQDKAEEGKEAAEEEVVKTMKGVVLTGYGGLRNLKEQQKAQPSPPAEGRVLIRVKACGMGFQDLMLRQGNVEQPPRTPFIMGCECAGVVEAVGEGPDPSPFAVGDRVIALTESGAWAELVAAPLTQVYKLPQGVTFEDGVCLLTHYVTAYAMLFDLAHLHPGKSILVHSAAGGVGQAVLQLCSMVGEVTVFGTASAHKHDSIKDRVTHLFPHTADYVQEIRKVSPEGVDIVLDCLCGEDTNRGILLLKPMGNYILYGTSNVVSGETKSIISSAKSWWQLDKVSPHKLYEENRMIGGFNLSHLLFRQGQHAYVHSVVNKLLDLCVQGKVKPVVDSVWAFGDVAEGMQRLHERKNIGKVLLDPTKEASTKRADSRADSKAAMVEPEEAASKSEDVKDDQKAETEETPTSTEQ